MLSQLVEESRHRRNVVGKEFYSGERTYWCEFQMSLDDGDSSFTEDKTIKVEKDIDLKQATQKNRMMSNILLQFGLF